MSDNELNIQVTTKTENELADEIVFGLPEMSSGELALIHESAFGTAVFVKDECDFVTVPTSDIEIWFDHMKEKGRAKLLDARDASSHSISYAFDGNRAGTYFESEQKAMRHAFEIYYINQKEPSTK